MNHLRPVYTSLPLLYENKKKKFTAPFVIIKITVIYNGGFHPPQQFKTAFQSLSWSVLPAIIWPLIHSNQRRRFPTVISKQWDWGGHFKRLHVWFLQKDGVQQHFKTYLRVRIAIMHEINDDAIIISLVDHVL